MRHDATVSKHNKNKKKNKAKGNHLQGMSGIPAKSILQQIVKTIVNIFPTASYCRKICEKTIDERSDLGNHTTRWTKQSKSERSVVRAEQLGSCAEFFETNREFVRKESMRSAQQHLYLHRYNQLN